MSIKHGLAVLRHPEYAAMALYVAFTLTALVGYATFGLHPDWLAGRPRLAAFYAQSFTFFGRGHVLLGALVLGIFLIRNAGIEWVPAFGIVYVVSFLSEFVGTGFGLPFGHYYYTDLLGPQWFDRVPILIPLSWFLMVLPAYAIVRQHSSTGWGVAGRVVLAAVLFVIWDLTLDVAMSHLTPYWVWEEAGLYYGMPLMNLGGWMLTALVLMALMEVFTYSWVDQLSVRWCLGYYGVTLAMPLGMVLAAGIWLPVLLTLVAFALLAAILRRDIRGGPDGLESHADASGKTPRSEVSAAELARIVGQDSAEAMFHHHARSFSFAAWWFPARERRIVACLYAFCRTTDDLVDGANGLEREAVERRLESWRELAKRTYEGESSGIRWLDEIMTASAQAGVPPRLIDELVEGVRTDIGRVNLQTIDDLDAYSYRVASVVGIWKCYLAGASHPETLQRAAAMGRAMQLTNILRDVGEDLASGRIYLPAELRRRYGITEQDLVEMQEAGAVTPDYRSMISTIVGWAEAEYSLAFPGLEALPRAYARACAVAAEVYRGIHGAIRRNDYDNLTQRAYTGPFRKVYLGIRGLWRLWYGSRSAASAFSFMTSGRPYDFPSGMLGDAVGSAGGIPSIADHNRFVGSRDTGGSTSQGGR